MISESALTIAYDPLIATWLMPLRECDIVTRICLRGIMKIRTLALCLSILAMLLIVSSCSTGASSTTPASIASLDGATLVQERCSACHPLARIESRNHPSTELKGIVDTMIRRGAQP